MTEIIALKEIKNWLRIDNAQDDYILESLRVTCVDYAEKYTGIYFIQKSVVINFSGLQTTKYERYPYIDLPKSYISSVQKVESIQDSTATLILGTYYTFKNDSNGIRRIIFTTLPAYDTTEPYPFIVSFTSGFGASSSDIPDGIKIAIKTHIAYLYENRGDVQSEGALSVSKETISLLNMYKVRTVF